MRMATCHPDKEHVAHGLCKNCYDKWKRKNSIQKAICHPDRPHRANGLCESCYQSKWIADNPKRDEYLRRKRERYHLTKSIALPKRRKYAKEHPELNAQKSRHWRSVNPEKARAFVESSKQKRLERDPSYDRRALREWKHKNPEKVKTYQASRRAKKFGKENSATDTERSWRVLLFGGICAYCGGKYQHTDHVVALSKDGGDHAGNLVPACLRCNTSKSNKDWLTWYRNRKYYDPKRERFIAENIW